MNDKNTKHPNSRPFKFMVDGYLRVVHERNGKSALRVATRRWGGKAIPQFKA